MRLLIQRVSNASVIVNSEERGYIEKGIVVYVSFSEDDRFRDDWFKLFSKVADKLIGLRIFPDEKGKMNLSIADIGGGIILVSNFTLYADISRGKRPSFSMALAPDMAKKLYLDFENTLGERMRQSNLTFVHGTFGADMIIYSSAWGPVNIVWDV